jgi:hypothetical protein
LLQPPQGLGIPVLPYSILPLLELRSPQEAPQKALSGRCPKDPRRNFQHLASRYLVWVEGSRCRLGKGLGFVLFLNAIHSRRRLGKLCWVP